MRVCFLIHDLEPSGGLRVVLGHAEHLAAAGWEVELVMTAGDASVGSVRGVPVLSPASASGERYDVAVATWWETAAAMFEIDARRRVVFLQSVEELFYREDELTDALGAASVLSLPVDFVAVSSWIRDLLRDLRPDARCSVVPNGVDKAAFRPRAAAWADPGVPLRVLVEGQPDIWFKGVHDALAAAESMVQPAEVSLVVADPRAPAAAQTGVERLVGGLDRDGMARAYAEADVLLKLSRFEGLGLAPLEGFHVGVPCVVTPFGGHGDYLEHGRNGIVTGFDDVVSTARWLDLLAEHRSLLGRLSEGALATAASWPGESRSTEMLADALSALAAEAPPAHDPALADGLHTVRLWSELTRQRFISLGWERDYYADRGTGKDRSPALHGAALARKLLRRARRSA